MRMFLAVAALIAASQIATAERQVQGPSGLICPAEAATMARLELVFGARRPDGTMVDQTEWDAFLDTEITPRFPDGLTVLTGHGQWRNRDGRLISETSRVLVIWYQPTAATELAIEAIRSAYRTRFAQESVLRADGLSCVSF